MQASITGSTPVNSTMKREWSDIVRHYDELAKDSGFNIPYFTELRDLVVYLEKTGYVSAGLCGSTSMFDLVLGHCNKVYENPHIRIDIHTEWKAPWTLGPPQFRIRYVNPRDYRWYDKKEWNIHVDLGTLIQRVERLLVKRLRWFKNENTFGVGNPSVGLCDRSDIEFPTPHIDG